MHDISSLKNRINTLIKKVTSNVFEYTKKETLNSQLKRVEKIEEILEKKKYKIVFIGTIGAGKTTAISHLFNMTSIVQKKVIRGRKNKTIEVIEPLLSTGSGRTTICEVEIKSSENLSIEIVPFSKDELEYEIVEFCKTFF